MGTNVISTFGKGSWSARASKFPHKDSSASPGSKHKEKSVASTAAGGFVLAGSQEIREMEKTPRPSLVAWRTPSTRIVRSPIHTHQTTHRAQVSYTLIRLLEELRSLDQEQSVTKWCWTAIVPAEESLITLTASMTGSDLQIEKTFRQQCTSWSRKSLRLFKKD